MLERPDSLRASRDSIRMAATLAEIDSLAAADFAADSAYLAATRTDDLRTLDSLMRARTDSLGLAAQLPPRRAPRKGWFMSDSMSLSKVAWLSTVLPGHGRAHNKTVLEAADPLRHGGHGTRPIHPRKQHLPSAQARLRRLHGQEPRAHARARRAADQADPQQHAAPDLSGRDDRLLRLLHRRRGGQLRHQRRLARQEGDDAGLHLPRRRSDLQQKLLEGALRRRRLRLDDLLHRLEQPRLPAFQEGLQPAGRLRPASRPLPRRPDRRVPRTLLGVVPAQPAQQLPPQPRPLHHHHRCALRPADRRRPCRRPPEGLRHL